MSAQEQTALPAAGGRESPSPLDVLHLDLLRESLQRFGRARLRVYGTSMLPSLWPGDVVEVSRVESASLRPGDVLLLHREQRLFCHRLLRWVEQDGGRLLCTRGDHLSAADPLFPLDCLLGRVEIPYRRVLVRILAPLLRAAATVSERLLLTLLPGRASRRLGTR